MVDDHSLKIPLQSRGNSQDYFGGEARNGWLSFTRTECTHPVQVSKEVSLSNQAFQSYLNRI